MPPAPTESFDLAIIGCGALGLATALHLSTHHTQSLIVLDTEQEIAAHQTGHNSGVIHAGLYYKPGSLKSQLCTEGRHLLLQFCKARNIPHETCGKLVIATTDSELRALAELERRAQSNGLENVRRLTPAEFQQIEPHATGLAALHVPQTGIVDYKQVATEYANAATERGATILLNHHVRAVSLENPAHLTLHTTKGDFRARALINCAGLHSDRVATMCGLEPNVRIIPFRGEYYRLAPHAAHLVRHLIYPVPDPRLPFLGVHFTRRIDGQTEAGPNAVLALARHAYSWRTCSPRDLADTALYPGFWRLARKHLLTGCHEIHRSLSKPAFTRALQKLVPEITEHDLLPGGSGIRAQAVDRTGALVDDFRILQTDRMIHVLNAPSPAATASLAIARHITTLALSSTLLPTRNAT